jgi:hypothetical protein
METLIHPESTATMIAVTTMAARDPVTFPGFLGGNSFCGSESDLSCEVSISMQYHHNRLS